ncbi:MAG: sulfur oxidation c-type cytochrome SoxA [Betaproteobacteria bacterium]|nr:sulfur oxidation c-type cytochrome SoxA [Betaproteobacteria bacterium]
MKPLLVLGAVVGTLSCGAVLAQQVVNKPAPPKKAVTKQEAAKSTKDATTAEFEKFREVLEADSPAELFEAKGEDIWKNKRGPDGGSMAQCDLGLGAGVVRGAYVQMPRYFADADKVMDAERRVVHCMTRYLGYQEADIRKQPFSNEQNTPDHVSVVTYVASQSRGMAVAVPQKHPREREAYELGKAVFAYRAGPYDFSCETCHGDDGKRIRMQQLPNLAKKEDAMKSFQGWPGYRMTGGFMLTQQWRMNDCFRQQRFPEPKYLSDAVTTLLTYLTVNANGNVYKGPGVKR